MPLIPESVYSRVPRAWALALTVAATVLATLAALGVLAAVAFGSWIPALLAALGFVVAGVLWHLAERAAH